MNTVPSLAPDGIEAVFAHQKQQQWQLRREPAAARVRRLRMLQDAIQAHEGRIRDALHADLGKPRQGEGELVVLRDIDEAVENLSAWMADECFGPDARLGVSAARIHREPRGVVLVFGPWNFPFQLVFQPLVAAIAAGNCAIVKPNELAPHTSRVTASVIRSVFAPHEVAVFEGGVPLAQQLLALPFDHIFFTGSPAVGRQVMAAAARHLATVTLELGGKNPVVVGPGADLRTVAARVMWARVRNAGQVCLCPEYVFVPAHERDEFVAQLGRVIQEEIDAGEGTGHIVDARNLERVRAHLDDALARGARLAWGGQIDAARRTVQPTVLLDVPDDATLMQDEVFAPILVVKTYDDLHDACGYVQVRPKPLALYVFSDDEAFVQAVIGHTASGGVTVNGCYAHCWDARLPFGGVNGSGMGRYHGVHGFRELSHERAVAHVDHR